MYGNKSNNWYNETNGGIVNYCMHMSVPLYPEIVGTEAKIIHMALIQTYWKEMMP